MTHPLVTLHHGDALHVLATIPDASVNAVVTDPPYALDFMGKGWDKFTPGDFQHWCEQWATECLRILKPGGHLLAFGGTRTSHRLTAGIEDAGFEIRDSIAWLYGSGFPKSLDVGKAIDKAAGATREVVRARTYEPTNGGGYSGNLNTNKPRSESSEITAPATPEAQQWHGWGTAMKPAHEPIVVARKPLAGTVAANVLAHGTGALNIDACRVETTDNLNGGAYAQTTSKNGADASSYATGQTGAEFAQPAGRWPTNVVLDQAAADALDEQTGQLTSGKMRPTHTTTTSRGTYGGDAADSFTTMETYGDTGGASRFFPVFRYQAKAPTRERPKAEDGTAHPTVKPLELMRWLVRLVTPADGTVLEPFAGSGTTVEACILEGAHCIAIERDETYLPLIEQRIARQAATAAATPTPAATTVPVAPTPSLFDDEESAP